MDNIQVLIVEDDAIIAADIEASLSQMGFGVTDVLEAGEQVLESISKKKPDLVLMDIQLEGDMDGIQTAHLLNEKYPLPIIFLTANTDRVTFDRAKETLPYAFIGKPFDSADLERGIELAIQKFAGAKTEKNNPESEGDTVILTDRIFLKDKRKFLVKVFLEDILFIHAQGNYCDILTKEKKYTVTSNLKNFEYKLDDKNFVRVHRSYLVNLKHIDEIGDLYLHLKEHQIPLAQSYRANFFSKLKLM